MLLLLFSYSITLLDTRSGGRDRKISTIIIMRYLLSRIERERYNTLNGNLKHSIQSFSHIQWFSTHNQTTLILRINRKEMFLLLLKIFDIHQRLQSNVKRKKCVINMIRKQSVLSSLLSIKNFFLVFKNENMKIRRGKMRTF